MEKINPLKSLFSSIYLGSVKGIPIALLTVTILTILALALGAVISLGYLEALKLIAKFTIVFTSITLHELGHSLVALKFGIKTKRILLTPIGGMAIIERDPKGKQGFWIAIAGPTVTLIIAWISLGIYLLLTKFFDPSVFSTVVKWMLMLNVALLLFNMIPAYPMDGGRIFNYMLSFFMPKKNLMVSRYIALLFLGAFIVVGIYARAFTLVLIGTLLGFDNIYELFFKKPAKDENVVYEDVLNSILNEMKNISPKDFHSILEKLDKSPKVSQQIKCGVLARYVNLPLPCDVNKKCIHCSFYQTHKEDVCISN